MSPVTFRVLGPVGAHDTDELDLGGLRQRAVLARLLVARGQVVPVDTLLFDLWDDDAGKGAQSGLQVYISRLRRVLEPNRPRGGPNRLLVTVASGYALRAAPEQVDALSFEAMVRLAGERLDESPQAARARLDAALALWHGTPYSDFADQPWAEAEVARLSELRLVARERHADAGLRMGLHAETVPDLEALTTEHALREEGWRLLALGLYRCGRQGDALAALRRARTILSDELGIDPGPALRKLESDILAQAPGLELVLPAPRRPPEISATWPPRPVATGDAPPLEPEPFVGRDAELAALAAAVPRAQAGRFTVAVISGDPGAGKTTLVRRLFERLEREGWIGATGGCPDSTATPPGWAWVEVLRALVARRGAGEYAALLAPLLDDTAPDSADDEASGGFRLHRAVGGYLSAVAREAPLLILLEDLHWADDQTLALLRALPSLLAASRVLVVVTCRDGELNDQQQDVLAALARLHPVRVGLGGLDDAAVAELVRATCVHEVDDEVVSTIVERAGGNPFFVKETARLFEAEADISEVPSGVRDVLRRRIARLPERAQQVLLQAAVIGRDVDVDVLVDVSGDEDAVVDAVEAALLAGLVTEPGPGLLRFDHDLVRDTLYSDASRLRRSRLHGAVASVIEQRSPNDVAALAHHYDAAGTVETAAKAVRYTGLAAEQAERRFAHREAATLWQQAIAAFDRAQAGRAHAGRGPVRERLELQLRLIRALALCGDMTAARAHRGEAMSVALPLGDLELTARVAAALAVPHKGIARDFTRTAWEIVDVTEKALVELPEGEQSLRASLLATLALELEGSATERGYQASLEAEELARASGDPALLAMALSGRLRQSYTLTQVDEREIIGRELLRVGTESGQIAVQTLAHLVLLECAAARGDFTEADEHLAQAEGLGRRYDLPAPAAVGAWYAGQRLMITGDYAAAERAYRNAARLTARAGMLEGRQDLPLIATFCLHLVDGRAAEMAEPLGEAHQRGAKWTLDAYAVALASAGHVRDARVVAASREPVRTDFLYELALIWRALAGMLLDDADRMREAYEKLAPFRDRIAGAGTGVVALWPVARTLGDLAVRLGLPARDHYEKALAVAERVGVPRWVADAREALAGV
ncbi:AfsR/SARP family transcriptional regulator [Microbispora sp. H11081]|uniref:AfsR/SARP family transcriptional regulator n=1 Tax=Microbispora sp. H11081 TaxID=2729107 RepID=UPI001475FEDF|nr:AfsR/SARP family transcriptional regulator [Microbispora sp. H11081]